jgi:hypothetical protein
VQAQQHENDDDRGEQRNADSDPHVAQHLGAQRLDALGRLRLRQPFLDRLAGLVADALRAAASAAVAGTLIEGLDLVWYARDRASD